MGIYLKIKFNICVKKGRRNVFKKSIDRTFVPTHVMGGILNMIPISLLNSALLFRSIFPSIGFVSSGIVEAAQAQEEKEYVEESVQKPSKSDVEEVGDLKAETSVFYKFYDCILEDKYKKLAGEYFFGNVKPYLPIIDDILSEKGLDNDALFIQAMFYIGQHESHWNTGAVSGATYGGEHATGLFQFLPSTFRSVSKGNIYNAEDQIRAYVTMAERGRLHEFGTLYIKTLNPSVKAYACNYRSQ